MKKSKQKVPYADYEKISVSKSFWLHSEFFRSHLILGQKFQNTFQVKEQQVYSDSISIKTHKFKENDQNNTHQFTMATL